MAHGMGMSLFGDWGKAVDIMGSLAEKFKQAGHRAMLQEGHFLRGEVIKYIREGELKPLTKKTLAMRIFEKFKGTRALMRKGDFRNSIVVKATGDSVFVGVLKTAKNKDGKSLANIAEQNEFGSKPIVIHVTAKSSRYYHAAMAKAGIILPKKASKGFPVVVIRIPPRPVFTPVFMKHAQPEEVRKRFYERVSEMLWHHKGK